MKRIVNKIAFVFIVIAFAGCKKYLDRPPLTTETDETAWTSEEKLRLYANKYYSGFFPGYTGSGAPLISNTNNDDMVTLGSQPNLQRAVLSSSIWDYSTIRSLNIMLDRIETKMSGVLSVSAKAHWLGVGRFFRAFEYAKLVQSYGDVPYYASVVLETDFDELYKPRTPRNEVMDAVYDDLQFAMQNVRTSDGDQYLNRYVVAGVVSRLALVEGTWQKYYYHNNAQAEKFLKLAIDAADIVITSGKYDIVTDYRSLFTSKKLAGNKDCILYRSYDLANSVTHGVATMSNLTQSVLIGPSTDLLKIYILTNGEVWQSPGALSGSFALDNMIVSRDSRFEATFYNKPYQLNKASYFYVNKFFPRDVERVTRPDLTSPEPMPGDFTLSNNETDAPVLRYAEILLNWIEAKAEFAELGGPPVIPGDITKSINKIRLRPLAQEAIDRGVTKTAPLNMSALPNDPDRDPSVSALLWEIRRERRMEFAFESFRLADLRRWSKLEYMDNNLNADLMSGGWVNFQTFTPDQLTSTNIGKLTVVSASGVETVYNGTNKAAMIGFFKDAESQGRQPFLNQANINPYLTPIGLVQMDAYKTRGYQLQQTQGWPQN